MTPTRIVLEQIVVDADFVDWASHIQQVNPTIGIWVHSILHPRHPVSIADAFLVVASRAKTMRWVQHMRYNWWVVSRGDCSDPYLNPTTPPDDAMHVHRSDANGDFVLRQNAIEKGWVMS
jgi:hypothetical protein